VVGIWLFLGKSSTQLADFIRRTAELIAIIVSWAIFRITHKEPALAQDRARALERVANLSVGIAMCLGGLGMLLMAFLFPSQEKGNVIPGLVIAILGVLTNTWFWLRYRHLNQLSPNAILAIQSRLYRAKSLVDTAVTAALITVAAAPGSPAAAVMDIAGSAVVALYLLYSGIKITVPGTVTQLS
jgi:divalent metal cation (Fe/Co/Zn/Cd) transporter